jgi:WD40 repeat protein
MKPTCLI